MVHHAVRERAVQLIVARSHDNTVELAPGLDLEVRLPHDAGVQPLRFWARRHDASVVVREHSDRPARELRFEDPLAGGVERDAVDQRNLVARICRALEHSFDFTGGH